MSEQGVWGGGVVGVCVYLVTASKGTVGLLRPLFIYLFTLIIT